MDGLISGIAGLADAVAALAFVVYWIVCLTKWDGDGHCDETQCPSCPFPCGKHDDR